VNKNGINSKIKSATFANGKRQDSGNQVNTAATNYALGEIEEIANGRMKAIEILLKKSVPDLQSIELTGDEENPVVTRVITGVPRDK